MLSMSKAHHQTEGECEGEEDIDDGLAGTSTFPNKALCFCFVLFFVSPRDVSFTL